ncbi:MAG TPA: hypothetical protein VIN63_07920 [Candidatus Limnocylindria bacterium]
MAARVYALVILALVSAVFLMLTLTSSATFTAPTVNPSNQLATATLAAPTGVSATVQSNGGMVRVAWTATSSIWANGHRVFRATNAGGPYSQIQQIAGLATVTYDDVPGAGTFYYVVRGYYNANGANWESIDSAQASAKPLDHFTFNAIAAQHSGTAFNVTITAQAQDNSTVTGFTGTVTLATNSGVIAPTTSGAFVAGVRTESVTITGPYKTNQTISATGGSPSRTGTSGVFVLDHFRATALAITNKAGGVAGKPENGDTLVLTFSEAANAASMGTCNGATNSGTDLLTNDTNPDTVTSNGTNLSFGTIALGNNGYFTASKTAKNSTCAWTAGNTVLTITLQGVASVGTVAGASTATYTPNSALTSAAGEAVDTAQIPSVTAVLF